MEQEQQEFIYRLAERIYRSKTMLDKTDWVYLPKAEKLTYVRAAVEAYQMVSARVSLHGEESIYHSTLTRE